MTFELSSIRILIINHHSNHHHHHHRHRHCYHRPFPRTSGPACTWSSTSHDPRWTSTSLASRRRRCRECEGHSRGQGRRGRRQQNRWSAKVPGWRTRCSALADHLLMDGSMNELMNGWIDERVNGWMDRWTSEWMDGSMNEWMDRWTSESMNGWNEEIK